MKQGLKGRKLGMTQVFEKTGEVVPVTVVQVEESVVVDIKTTENDGYRAIVLGTELVTKKTAVNKPQKGLFAKAKSDHFKKLYERKLKSDEEYKIGDTLTVNIFSDIKLIDVTGTSKGKGFAGVIKRHNMGGGSKSHGNSKAHRLVGSTGNITGPGRCFKRTRMAGHMGAATVTVEKLEVVSIIEDKKLMLIKGSVPGAVGSMVEIRKSIKSK